MVLWVNQAFYRHAASRSSVCRASRWTTDCGSAPCKQPTDGFLTTSSGWWDESFVVVCNVQEWQISHQIKAASYRCLPTFSFVVHCPCLTEWSTDWTEQLYLPTECRIQEKKFAVRKNNLAFKVMKSMPLQSFSYVLQITRRSREYYTER